VACAAVLAFRHGNGSNQFGDLHPGAYSDWTGYVSVNPPRAPCRSIQRWCSILTTGSR
jgi:hypothetical protein